MQTKTQNLLILILFLAVGYLGYQEIKRYTDLNTDPNVKPVIVKNGRSATLDSLSLVNTKGEVVLTFGAEPVPYAEVKNKRGQLKRLDLQKLVDKADMFTEDINSK